jgi:hypothetical protein
MQKLRDVSTRRSWLLARSVRSQRLEAALAAFQAAPRWHSAGATHVLDLARAMQMQSR